jgi:hypothetical protein
VGGKIFLNIRHHRAIFRHILENERRVSGKGEMAAKRLYPYGLGNNVDFILRASECHEEYSEVK